MALTLTCLNVSLSLPSVPLLNNLTAFISHPPYTPNGQGPSELISSSLARSTFSTADVEAFLKLITSDPGPVWDASTVVGTKPLPSIIIYLSVTLALFLILSLVFCIVTCTRCPRRKSMEMNGEYRRKCSLKNICAVLMLMLTLAVIAVMIYVTYRISQVKDSLSSSIREINQEVYPKEISIHFEHLLDELEELERYSTQNNSIVITASRSLLVKAFDDILRQRYFLNAIAQSVADSQTHIEELNELIEQDANVSAAVIVLFNQTVENNRKMIEYLKEPIAEVCGYADGSGTDVDASIFDALDQVRQQLRKLIDRIQGDILSSLKPWENAMLLNQSLEDKVQWYIGLVGIILLVFIPVMGLIPIVFSLLLLLLICRRRPSRGQRREETLQSRKAPTAGLCSMRLVFGLTMVMMIITVLLGGILYGVDLLVQGACRVVHDDQPFLISFLTDQLIGSDTDDLIIGGSDLQTTLININLLTGVDNSTQEAMNRLNKKVFDAFNSSIDAINIASDLDNLELFSKLVGSRDIEEKARELINDLTLIKTQFDKITISVPGLPVDLINKTIDEFKMYVDRVLNRTIDTCPLPLATMYKADTLVCHSLAGSINGLWFSIFIYLFLIIFGFCLCGLCAYKRF